MTNPLKVFVVESEEFLIDAIVLYAKLQQNHDILIAPIARNEKEALKLVLTRSYDVALIDIELPINKTKTAKDKEAGLRVVKALGSQPGAPKVLAFSTVITKPEFIIRVIRAGAAGYVSKESATLDQLFNAMRGIYKGRKVFPEDIMQYALERDSQVSQLSKKDLELWRLIADGYSGEAIAERMNLSINTVKHLTSNLYIKIGVNNRAQAVRVWVEKQYGGFSDS